MQSDTEHVRRLRLAAFRSTPVSVSDHTAATQSATNRNSHFARPLSGRTVAASHSERAAHHATIDRVRVAGRRRDDAAPVRAVTASIRTRTAERWSTNAAGQLEVSGNHRNLDLETRGRPVQTDPVDPLCVPAAWLGTDDSETGSPRRMLT